MAVLDGVLDIVRVVVDTADDDDVLEPADDIELTIVYEAQIAGAQIRSLPVTKYAPNVSAVSTGLRQ